MDKPPLTEDERSVIAGKLERLLSEFGIIGAANVPAFVNLEAGVIRIETWPTKPAPAAQTILWRRDAEQAEPTKTRKASGEPREHKATKKGRKPR